MALPDPVMTVDDLNDKLATAFEEGRPYEVTAVAPGRVTLRIDADRVVIRPGGTVSGPTLMMLADAGAWAVVLAHIGWVPLAVTSQLSINFLRKPEPAAVEADVELRKLGRRLAVTDVCLYSVPDGGERVLVADASVTYAIPASATA